jgi:hypothetical protein
LVAHRDALVTVLEASDSDSRRAALDALEARLEEHLGPALQRQAKAALVLHDRLNQKLERLVTADATLDPGEQRELRMLRLLKSMQVAEPPDSAQ